MTRYAYHASHEQFAPSELLRLAVLAEQCGFGAISSSDHFHPWSERQGQSGFALAWLGAAMGATSLPFSLVCAPGQRYHPAILAQAVATLGEMFEGRLAVALGSGEAINETITGDPWPQKSVRNARLEACYRIMAELLAGQEVSRQGHATVSHARLYSLPQQQPLIIGAALSIETAAWMGGWAPGLITTHRPVAALRGLIDAYRSNGGAGKPLYLKVQLSYARDPEAALDGAYDQWRTNVLPGDKLADLERVADFDREAESVSRQDLYGQVLVSADLPEFVARLREYAALGFERIILHNVNRDQETFIRDFGREVLPALT